MKLILAAILHCLPALKIQASTSRLSQRAVASEAPSALRRPLLEPMRVMRLPWHLRLKIACIPHFRPAATTLYRILQRRLGHYGHPTSEERLRELLAISQQCASRHVTAEQLAMEIIGTQIMASGSERREALALHALFCAMDHDTLLAHYRAPALGGDAYAMASRALLESITMRQIAVDIQPAATTLNNLWQQRLRDYDNPTAKQRWRALRTICQQYATRHTSAEQLAMAIVGTQMMACDIEDRDALALHTQVFCAMDQATLLAHYRAADPGGEAYAMAFMAIRGNIGQRADRLQADCDGAALAHFEQLFELQ